MSSASQWPSRPAGSDVSGPLRTGESGVRQQQQPVKGYPDLPAVTAFCLEALDGALELVRADGGEVAALDASGTAMVTRARRKRPPRIPGFGDDIQARLERQYSLQPFPEHMMIVDEGHTQAHGFISPHWFYERG